MNLYSRYEDTWELTETKDGYIFKVPNYTRIGYFPDSHEDIYFIDPPGGPFMTVGGMLGEDELITGFLDLGKDEGILIYTHKKEGSE